MADGGIQGSGTCCQSWELTLCIFVRLDISRHTSFLLHHTDPLTFGKQALTHRLVLGAFRTVKPPHPHPYTTTRLNAPSGAWCFPTSARSPPARSSRSSQCTFWCLVLSDDPIPRIRGVGLLRLNAPSGAWCFPTHYRRRRGRIMTKSQCTFWCLVLSDKFH